MLGIMLTVNLSCFVRLCCSSLGLSPDTALPRMLRGRSRVLQSVGADAESCGAAQPSEVVPPALCSATCSVQCHVPVPSLQPAPRLSRFAHEPSDVVSKPPARPLFHPQGLLAISEQPRAHRGRFLTAPPPVLQHRIPLCCPRHHSHRIRASLCICTAAPSSTACTQQGAVLHSARFTLLPLAPSSGRTRAVVWPGTAPLSKHENFSTAPVHPYHTSDAHSAARHGRAPAAHRAAAQPPEARARVRPSRRRSALRSRFHPPRRRSALGSLRHPPRRRSSRPARLPAAPPDGAAALPPPPPERGPRRSWCGAAGPGRGRRGGREERALGGRRRGSEAASPLLSLRRARRAEAARDGGVRRRHRAVSTGPGPAGGRGGAAGVARRRRWPSEGGRGGGGAP